MEGFLNRVGRNGVWSLEFGVWSLEFGVWSLEFGVWSLEFGVYSLEFIVYSTPDWEYQSKKPNIKKILQ